ncbi:hypothetical protein OENI_50028 [Oenococcus oeni]|nr:hypothetical protein OENI_50028 [Oenococcus oeni]
MGLAKLLSNGQNGDAFFMVVLVIRIAILQVGPNLKKTKKLKKPMKQSKKRILFVKQSRILFLNIS